MKVPWVNSALIIFLTTLVVSGFLGLKNGFAAGGWLLWIHSGAAYGLVMLFFGKGVVITDAWRRKNRWTPARIGFVIMLLLLMGVIGLGLGWTFYGPLYWGGFSLVSLHIYVAVPVMIMILWHGRRMRFIFRVDGVAGRRLFIGSAVPALLGVGLWQAGVRLQSRVNRSSVTQRFTGSYLWVGEPGRFPVTSWIVDNPAPLAAADWRLTIRGAVETPLVLTLADLLARPGESRAVVLDCTSGWYSEQVWRGVSLGDVLDGAGLTAEARSITVRAVSGYQRRFNIEEARSFLLAYEVAGRPLSHGHGFPVRLVAPGRRGFEWVKWVAEIELNQTAAFWQSPLPLR